MPANNSRKWLVARTSDYEAGGFWALECSGPTKTVRSLHRLHLRSSGGGLPAAHDL